MRCINTQVLWPQSDRAQYLTQNCLQIFQGWAVDQKCPNVVDAWEYHHHCPLLFITLTKISMPAPANSAFLVFALKAEQTTGAKSIFCSTLCCYRSRSWHGATLTWFEEVIGSSMQFFLQFRPAIREGQPGNCRPHQKISETVWKRLKAVLLLGKTISCNHFAHPPSKISAGCDTVAVGNGSEWSLQKYWLDFEIFSGNNNEIRYSNWGKHIRSLISKPFFDIAEFAFQRNCPWLMIKVAKHVNVAADVSRLASRTMYARRDMWGMVMIASDQQTAAAR